MSENDESIDEGELSYYDDMSDYAVDALFTAGFMLFGVLFLVIGLNWFNMQFDFLDFDKTAYHGAKLVIAFFALVIGILFMRYGFLLEGIIVGTLGLSSFCFSIVGLTATGMAFVWTDMMFGIVLLVCAYIAFMRKDWPLTTISITSGLGLLLYPIPLSMGVLMDDGMYAVIGLLFFIAGAMGMLYGLYNMLALEQFQNALIDE